MGSATWARQPQRVWLRRVLFQVHLWTGIGAGLYIVVASLSGSAVVFRREINRALSPVRPVQVPGRRRVSEPPEVRSVTWLVDLHDNLLGGDTGRIVNGAGGVLLTVLGLTGIVIWWPGVGGWRRSLGVRRGVGWRRLTWDLHSALGFWALALVLMFAISGTYLAFPDPFQRVVDYLEPQTDLSVVRPGDALLASLARLHFGRAYGTPAKVAWVLLGLIPPTLFVTGAITWWNRVVARRFTPSRRPASPGPHDRLLDR